MDKRKEVGKEAKAALGHNQSKSCKLPGKVESDLISCFFLGGGSGGALGRTRGNERKIKITKQSQLALLFLVHDLMKAERRMVIDGLLFIVVHELVPLDDQVSVRLAAFFVPGGTMIHAARQFPLPLRLLHAPKRASAERGSLTRLKGIGPAWWPGAPAPSR